MFAHVSIKHCTHFLFSLKYVTKRKKEGRIKTFTQFCVADSSVESKDAKGGPEWDQIRSYADLLKTTGRNCVFWTVANHYLLWFISIYKTFVFSCVSAIRTLVRNRKTQQEKVSIFIHCDLFHRAFGRRSIRQWGAVLWRPMGLKNGQPDRRHTKKNCYFLSARGGLSHFRRHPETVQRATEDLPAGACPPTHCHHHFSIP